MLAAADGHIAELAMEYESAATLPRTGSCSVFKTRSCGEGPLEFDTMSHVHPVRMGREHSHSDGAYTAPDRRNGSHTPPMGHRSSLTESGRQLGVQQGVPLTGVPTLGAFRSVVGSLENAICTRLDRIESSLQSLHRQPEPKERLLTASRDFSPVRRAPSYTLEELPRARKTPSCEVEDFPRVSSEPNSWEDVVLGGAEEVMIRSGSNDNDRFFRDPLPPEPLQLRPEWLQERKLSQAEAVLLLKDDGLSIVSRRPIFQQSESHSESELSEKPWFVLLPSSKLRISWDMVMMLAISHDMAFVPVSLAFSSNGEDVSFTEVLFWPLLLFWTLDIPLNFVTGFYTHGRVEVSPSKIARNYSFTWLPLDIFMVVSSWVTATASTTNHGYFLGRVGKGLRIYRVINSVRILRLAKLRRIADEFQDNVTSEYYLLMISMVKSVLAIVWLNHFIACSWWSIGMSMSVNGAQPSWVNDFIADETTIAYKYFTALHWSLTQFTPAGMEVNARNLPERVFSVFVLLFAMIAFSSFVSSITAAMTQLRKFYSPDRVNFSLLRRYLQGHQVPLDLRVRIMHFAEYHVRKRRNEVHESQVVLLQFLSKPLRMELSSHVFAPILTRHPFFQKYSDVDPEAMRDVCMEAMSQISLSEGDWLFREECLCEHLFFTMSGQLLYNMHCSQAWSQAPKIFKPFDAHSEDEVQRSSVKTMHRALLQEGEWCCEVSLWCPWTHIGRMVALQISEVLALNVAAFTSLTKLHYVSHSYSFRYSNLFVERVNTLAQEGNIVSDMSIGCSDTLEEISERAAIKGRTSFSRSGSPRSGSREFGVCPSPPLEVKTDVDNFSI